MFVCGYHPSPRIQCKLRTYSGEQIDVKGSTTISQFKFPVGLSSYHWWSQMEVDQAYWEEIGRSTWTGLCYPCMLCLQGPVYICNSLQFRTWSLKRNYCYNKYIVCSCSPEPSFLVNNSCYMGQLPKHLIVL